MILLSVHVADIYKLKRLFIAVFVYHRDIKEVYILLRYKRLSKTKIGENLISGKLNPARNKQTNERKTSPPLGCISNSIKERGRNKCLGILAAKAITM